MQIKDDEILVQLIDDLNLFTIGKSIEAIMFDPEVESIDGFNIFFDDGSALLVVVRNGQIFWKCATSNEVDDYMRSDEDDE